MLAQAGNPGARHSMENAVQEAKIINTRDMIRSFVKVADVAKAHIVPLPVGNVALSPSELDAFRADYVEEKSFRGEYVSALIYMIAVNTRVREEQKNAGCNAGGKCRTKKMFSDHGKLSGYCAPPITKRSWLSWRAGRTKSSSSAG